MQYVCVSVCSCFFNASSKVLDQHERGSRCSELLNCSAMAFAMFPFSQLIPMEGRLRDRVGKCFELLWETVATVSTPHRYIMEAEYPDIATPCIRV